MQSHVTRQIRTLMKLNIAVVAAAAVTAMICISVGRAAVERPTAVHFLPVDVTAPAGTLTNSTVISKDGDPYFDLHGEPDSHEVGRMNLCFLSACIDV